MSLVSVLEWKRRGRVGGVEKAVKSQRQREKFITVSNGYHLKPSIFSSSFSLVEISCENFKCAKYE
jgi:hypothetical protein